MNDYTDILNEMRAQVPDFPTDCQVVPEQCDRVTLTLRVPTEQMNGHDIEWWAMHVADVGKKKGKSWPTVVMWPQNELIEIDTTTETLDSLLTREEQYETLPTTWFDHYFLLAGGMVTAPDSFHQLVGLSMLSVVVNRKVGVELSHGQIFPNVWGLLVAPSTVYHKTRSQEFGRNMLHAVDANLIYPHDVTPEAMVTDVMAERGQGILMRDEFSGWLIGAKRDYQSTIKDLYMVLFDCPPTYTRTTRQGKVVVDKPFLSIMSGAVPTRFYRHIDEDDWFNGFLARFLFALPVGDPNFDSKTRLPTGAEIEERARLTGQLKAVYKHYREQGGVMFLGFEDGVLDRYDSYVGDANRRAYEHEYSDLMLPFVGRMGDYVLKFAILTQIARGLDGDTFTPPTVIDMASLRRGLEMAEGYANDTVKLIEGRENAVNGAIVQKVFGTIVRHPDGVVHSEALHLSHLKSEMFNRAVQKLAEVGAIETRNVKRPGARKSSKFYVATTNSLPIREW